jgi:outer membrane protein assembly factor BamB
MPSPFPGMNPYLERGNVWHDFHEEDDSMKNSSLPKAVIVALLLGAIGSSEPLRADWPLFRGNPLQNGVATSSLPDKLEIRWKIQVKDAVEATAAIVKDTVYFGAFDQNLYAVSLADGKEKWRYKAGAFKAPPSVFEGAVYVGDEDGMFHCVDAAAGKKRWTFETSGEITSGANFAGDQVLFGSHDSTLYSLRRKDGNETWKFKTQGPVNGSPVVAGAYTFVAGCDSNLHIVDLKSGKELVQIDLDGQAAATGAVLGHRLYVGTMTNEFKAIDLQKKAILWTYEPQRAQPFYGSAAVTEKLVIVGNRDKFIHALDRENGNLVWTFPTKGRVDGSPVVVGNRVYVGSSDGNLYVLDLAKGTEVQRLELGRGIIASPAVAHHCLVIGTTDGFVYCLGKKE